MAIASGERTPSVFERHPRTTLALTLVALLGGLEGGLRLFEPEVLRFLREARRVHAHSDAWRVDLVPERLAHLVLHADDGRLLYNFVLTTDALGLRGPDRDLDELRPLADRGARHVHAIGDSFTMGWGVAWSDAYPAILDRLLPQGVRVSNLGVDGFGTIAACEKSESLWNPLPPAHVVYLFHPGDLDDDARLLAFRARPLPLRFAGRLWDGLRRRSDLANLPYAVLWAGRLGAIRRSREVADVKPGRPDPAAAATLEVAVPLPTAAPASPSLAHLEAFAGRLAARGAGLTVLVLDPDDPRSLAFLAGARRAGLDARAIRVPPAWLLRREGHLSPAGAEALALYVRDRVLAPAGLAATLAE